jgi:hypothetical protein
LIAGQCDSGSSSRRGGRDQEKRIMRGYTDRGGDT